MGFNSIFCKLGNMRKPQEWVIYPPTKENANKVTIQCEQRIAQIDLTTGVCVLSNGKGGHQGFIKLTPMLGAKPYAVPKEIVDELKEKVQGIIIH